MGAVTPRVPPLLVLALAACRPAGPTVAPVQAAAVTTPAAPPRSAPVEPVPAVPVQAVPAVAGPGLPAALAELRAQGLAAIDAGRFDVARERFAAVLEGAPGNLATQALYDAATQAMLAAQSEAGAAFADRSPTLLAPPPWQYTLRREVAAPRGPSPKLVQVTEAKNAVTDVDEWLTRNNLALPEYEVPNPMRGEPGALPPTIPPTFGKHLLVQAIKQDGLNILFYGPDYAGGRFVAVQRDGGELVAFFDFEAWAYAPEAAPGERRFVEQRAAWAVVDGDVLYVSHGHRTYAKSSKGANAYISALDLRTGELLWRSAPLVANAANFVIVGGYILTGYGFTAEPDFLYVLERARGRTVGKTKLKSGPDYIFVRDGRVFVRCYDADYEFALKEGG